MSLIPSGRRDMLFHGKVGQERGYFAFTHFTGMPLSVKENEALNPMQVARLRAKAVMAGTDSIADLIHQFRLTHGCLLANGESAGLKGTMSLISGKSLFKSGLNAISEFVFKPTTLSYAPLIRRDRF